MKGAVTVFGIRHHGPGCARALVAALDAVRPGAVLVEGPADAQAAIPHLMEDGLVPPVAMLVYAADEPARSAFYPFARFSPEWNALAWAKRQGVPARFMDLPFGAGETPAPAEDVPPLLEEEPPHVDPLGVLARAAGYTDRELWWEHQVEQRRDATALFAGIREAMQAVREAFPDERPHEALREAHMRQAIRTALKDGHQHVAVVCGAWHAPVLTLDGGPSAKADAELLRGLPKAKTAVTWVPWTHGRLGYRSGYGAGVRAPGWYALLWDDPERAGLRFVTEAARLLRGQGLAGSTASAIEAVRLAEATAAVREAPAVGLPELLDAVQAVLCAGEPARLATIHQALLVGEVMGQVPEGVAAAPLQRDFEARARKLRLTVAPEARPLALDLRQETDRARSVLLHQLGLLGVAWGQKTARRAAGTFHEDWTLRWQPELVVTLIQRSAWGGTIADAAGAFVRSRAAEADLPALTRLLAALLPADLPTALDEVLARIRDAAALSADVAVILDALPPLAHVARYGDVRGTRADDVMPIFTALVERAILALAPTCASLDDEAARAMAGRVTRADAAIALLDRPDLITAWSDALAALAATDAQPGFLRGVAVRLLVQRRVLDEPTLARHAGLALAHAVPPAVAAAWIEGLVAGPASVLVHLDALWRALDAWLVAQPAEAFVEQLPALRRAFSAFDAAERRHMGDKVKGLGGAAPVAKAPAHDLDEARAMRVVPLLAAIMGVPS